MAFSIRSNLLSPLPLALLKATTHANQPAAAPNPTNMNYVPGPGLQGGPTTCLNCQTRPVNAGHQFCSKQCAHSHSGQGPPPQAPPNQSQPPYVVGPNPTQSNPQAPAAVGGPTCLIAGCGKPVWKDARGNPSQYCSTAHKKLGSGCQIPGCGKPVYTDAKGVKSQYCSYTHMMQGRQGNPAAAAGTAPVPNIPSMIPAQGSSSNPPGAYPSANPGTAPVSSHPAAQPGMCQLPGCQKPVWVDPTGNPSKYCGKGHMKQAASQPQPPTHQQQQQQTTQQQQQPAQQQQQQPTHQQQQQPTSQMQQQPHWNAPPPSLPNVSHTPTGSSSNAPRGPSSNLCWLCKAHPPRPGDMFCSDACTSKGQTFARDILEVHPLDNPNVSYEKPFPLPPTYQAYGVSGPTSSYPTNPGYGANTEKLGYGYGYGGSNEKRRSVESLDDSEMPD